MGRSHKKNDHPHAYRSAGTVAGIVRRICDGCGHISISSTDEIVVARTAAALDTRTTTMHSQVNAPKVYVDARTALEAGAA